MEKGQNFARAWRPFGGVYPEQGRRAQDEFAQDAAPRFSPTGSGWGEESGAFCICASVAVGV